jgi:hypothetical protein
MNYYIKDCERLFGKGPIKIGAQLYLKKFYSDLGGPRRRCGYPIGLIANKNSANDFDRYTIRNWLGFFQGSTSIIDTQMFGDIQLEITMAQSGVLMLGAIPVAANLAAITDLNSGTIATSTVCNYVAGGGRWLLGITTSTGVQPFQILVPGEGILCLYGIYTNSLNIASTQITYG